MRILTLAAALVATLALPAAAMDGKIIVEDPYARASSPSAKAGAAFMMLANHSGEDDRLIAVTTAAAERAEIHTHIADGDGVMRMVRIEDGIAVPAGGSAVLKRGGDHLMLLGLTRSFEQGDSIEVTLTFEKAGDMVVTIPIDLERKPAASAHGHGHDTGSHGHTN